MPSESLGYSFPNDLHILWSLMIVMYPYVTGLVAGAFIVSSLYHVFGRAELRPVGRLSMVASLAFLFVAPLPCPPPGPSRALFHILITPHFTSAMAVFGLIYALYLTLLIVEICLCTAETLFSSRPSTGLKGRSLLLALGCDISEEALRTTGASSSRSRRWAFRLPVFFTVCRLCWTVKANYWWST